MKNRHALFLSVAGVFSLGLVALTATAQSLLSMPSLADKPVNEVTLDASELAKCSLSAYTFAGKTDSRQFVYSMAGGKYMEGALLYGDCDYQSVGSDLSKPLVLDNSAQGTANAADFHLFFSAQGLLSASFTFDIELDKLPPVAVDFRYGAKFSNLCGKGLYDELKDRPYHEETPSTGVVDDWGATDLYQDGNYTSTQFTTSVKELANETFSKAPDATYAPYSAVAFYVNAYSVPAGLTLSITLKSVTLRYTC